MKTKVARITDEQLAEAVRSSPSVSAAMRKLNRNPHGSNHKHYSLRIRKLGIDTSHFEVFHHEVGGRPRRTAIGVLVLRPAGESRQGAKILRRSMLEVGVPLKCVFCGIADQWNGKPITLHIDHINGVAWDDRIKNLRFLCPNCHSQTETYGPQKNPMSKKSLRVCSKCSAPISAGSKSRICNGCFTQPAKIEWPKTKTLLRMVDENGYVQTGKELGVSDNAVRKHLSRELLKK